MKIIVSHEALQSLDVLLMYKEKRVPFSMACLERVDTQLAHYKESKLVL